MLPCPPKICALRVNYRACKSATILSGELMAQVYPFRAFRYNPDYSSFDRVLTQPYDKISPAMQDKYYAADPHNLIAIEKGRSFPEDTPAGVPDEKNVYTRAASALQSWIREQIVVQDTRPCFYSYTQQYSVPGTNERRT